MNNLTSEELQVLNALRKNDCDPTHIQKAKKLRYDYSALRQRIIDQYGTLKSFAAAMGIHPSTLRRWLTNVCYMSVGDIHKMAKLLQLADEEVHTLFCAPEKETVENFVESLIDLQILREFRKLTETQKKAFIASIPSILAQSSARPEEHISSPYSHNS